MDAPTDIAPPSRAALSAKSLLLILAVPDTTMPPPVSSAKLPAKVLSVMASEGSGCRLVAAAAPVA
jgi:hypothetical protein